MAVGLFFVTAMSMNEGYKYRVKCRVTYDHLGEVEDDVGIPGRYMLTTP